MWVDCTFVKGRKEGKEEKKTKKPTTLWEKLSPSKEHHS